MSCKVKCLLMSAALCLLNACGPTGSPEVATNENRSVDEAAPVVTGADNTPPQITSDPVIAVIPGFPYLYQPTATDPDNDILTWSLSQSPTGLQIDPATGLLMAEALPAGKHPVTLKVTDAQGGIDEQNFTIELPSGPVILSTPPTYTYTDTLYQYQLESVDTAGSGLQFAIRNGPPGMQIGQDGLLEWTADQPGLVEIKVVVSDMTGGAAEQIYVLNVLAPDGIAIVSTPVTQGWVSLPYEYSVSVIDASGTVNYSLVDAPAGMTIDASGDIRWTPVAEGSYPIVIRATNGNDDAEQEFVVEVSSLEKTDAMFTDIVQALFTRLSAGDTVGAMSHLTTAAQQRLGPVLKGFTAQVSDPTQFSPLVRVSIDVNSAEYMVRRTAADGEQVFMITFVRDQNLEWKIDNL